MIFNAGFRNLPINQINVKDLKKTNKSELRERPFYSINDNKLSLYGDRIEIHSSHAKTRVKTRDESVNNSYSNGANTEFSLQKYWKITYSSFTPKLIQNKRQLMSQIKSLITRQPESKDQSCWENDLLAKNLKTTKKSKIPSRQVTPSPRKIGQSTRKTNKSLSRFFSDIIDKIVFKP